MGGPGSGRWYRWDERETTDDYLQFSIRNLRRAGGLVPGTVGTSRWTQGDREYGSISWIVWGEADHTRVVELRYRISNDSIVERVPLTWTPCHYGGSRPWFHCPVCGRRVAILYGRRRFRCRHCCRLAYESTREDEASRHLRRARKIRQRLGGSPSVYDQFPVKPKWMHWRTYHRLYQIADDAELASHVALLAWLDKLTLQRDWPNG